MAEGLHFLGGPHGGGGGAHHFTAQQPVHLLHQGLHRDDTYD